MYYYHVIAIRPGDRRKTIINKTEEQVLAEYVLPFVSSGTIKANWGEKSQSYQVLELRVYRTPSVFDKKAGKGFDAFLKRAKNLYPRFGERAKEIIGQGSHRVFIIMPIQGEKYGTQNQQRIFREYDSRFKNIESVLSKFNCVAIRIDKEHPLEDIVGTIKREINRAKFVVADLTDERPSCYFEAGYAEALGKPIVFIASKESVGQPGTNTKIHFDIHMNVNFFTNYDELKEKLRDAVDKNKKTLFESKESEALITS